MERARVGREGDDGGFIFLDVSCVLWKNIEQSSKVMRLGSKITPPTERRRGLSNVADSKRNNE